MTMQGTIVIEGEAIYVRYETTRYTEAIRDVMHWRVERVERRGHCCWPAHGDVVTSSDSGYWNGRGYSVYHSSTKQAERFESTALPCPPTRGKPSRWRDGRWEKLMAKGWVQA